MTKTDPIRLTKAEAFRLLGTSKPAEVARELRITPQAVNDWPMVLSAAISDRVVAAIARRHLPPELIGGTAQEAANAG